MKDVINRETALPFVRRGRCALGAALALLVGAGGCIGSIDEGRQPPRAMTPSPGGERAGGIEAPGAPPGTEGRPGTPDMAEPAGTPSGVERPLPSTAGFACDPKIPLAGPRRLWRLTASQYRHAAATVLGGRSARGATATATSRAPIEAGKSTDRFGNLAASYAMSDVELRATQEIAAELADTLVAQLRADPAGCLGGAAPPPFARCASTLLAERGALAFRRPLTDEELGRFTAIATGNAVALGEEAALATAFQVMLMSPRFLFRSELGNGTPDAAGRVALTPFELASLLSFSLADRPPDEELWRLAASDTLRDPATLRAQARRLLGRLSENEALRRFLREYGGYAHAPAVFQVPKEVPFHEPRLLVADTDLWIQDLLAERGERGFLEALLTSPSAFVRKETARSYGLDTTKISSPTKMTFAPGERAGLLTQPSFLSAFAETGRTDPVKRGKFISESLLCRPVPPLPIGQVPPLPDLGPGATGRDRLKAHSVGTCAACHVLMDPLGLGLEGYDHVGRVRTLEAGKPVDTTGVLTGAGDGDGPFEGAPALAQRLADSPVVRACFVAHVFQALAGRPETGGDGCALQAGLEAFGRAGDLSELVLALVTSDAFTKRNTKEAH